MNIVHKLCTNKIEKNMYESQGEMQQMLDVFFGAGRVTEKEYLELTELLESKHK